MEALLDFQKQNWLVIIAKPNSPMRRPIGKGYGLKTNSPILFPTATGTKTVVPLDQLLGLRATF